MTKAVVITGGSKGIGRKALEVFRDLDYRPFNISRTSARLDQVTDLCCDLADPDAINALATPLQNHLAGMEKVVLVHNAGLLRKDRVDDVPPDEFRRVMQVNVLAPAALNQLVLPHMQPGSAILYISSTLGHKAVAGSCSYVTSKHALIGLMRSTCQDLAGRGIHTTAICPGFTDTEMLRDHVGHDGAVLQSIASMQTFGRLIQPEEQARTILFCAENPVLNGAVLDSHLGQIES